MQQQTRPTLFNLLGYAVRATLRRGYTLAHARADVMAGLVTGVVALPLSMALAIASGVPPEHGLYTAIVAGVITSLLGGAPLQVTGPTAAFVVLLVPVTAEYGLGGLCLTTAMAGVLLLAMALFRLGTLVRYVPQPVVLGFTGGIGIVIATLQLKDFLGLQIARMPETFIDKVSAIAMAMPTLRLADAAVGAVTLTLLLTVPRVTKRVPAALIALGAVTIGTVLLHQAMPEFAPSTIMGRFSYMLDGVRHAGIPRLPPLPSLSWFTMGPDNTHLRIDWTLLVALLPDAVAVALLAAIESLLAAVVADGMSGTRHEADAELLALSVANVASPFFGGFAATGAIARTAINIRSGARSPFAAVIHAGFVLLAILALAPVLGYLPMASLAALLLTVAWNMSDAHGIVRSLKTAPREDVFVLLASLTLTVVFDMVVSVGVGVLLSTVLFARKMAQAADVAHERSTHARRASEDNGAGLPFGVHVHTIDGPLFFGDADRALGSLRDLEEDAQAVVLDLSRVSLVDASGLASLEDAVCKLEAQLLPVVMVSPLQADVRRALDRSALGQRSSSDQVARIANRDAAIAWAAEQRRH